MILVVVFSQYCIKSIKLDISTLILLCAFIGMAFEAVRWRFNFGKLADGLKVFLQSMGKALAGVVSLVIAAGIFAEDFKALGMLDAIVGLASSVGAGAIGLSILFVVVTTIVAIVSGSNGASFYPIVEMVPKITKDMGVNPVTLVLPMHQASTIARSPLACRSRHRCARCPFGRSDRRKRHHLWPDRRGPQVHAREARQRHARACERRTFP